MVLKKVLFILSGNLSTTPRAVKLIQVLSENSECHVFYVDRAMIWRQEDEKLKFSENTRFVSVGLGRTPVFPWLKITFYQIISQVISRFYKKSLKIYAFASDKSSIRLVDAMRNVDFSDFNFVFGHSYGAMYPSYHISKKHTIPFIFDVEDYHPGEAQKGNVPFEKQRKEFLMTHILPHAHILTYASELIGKYTLDLIGGHSNHLLVLNSFKAQDFLEPKTRRSEKLRCVWFSQHIGPNRGLEQVFDTAKNLKHIEFHLIGNPNQNYLNGIELTDNVKLYNIMNQDDLHHLVSDMDVGLALENVNADDNRNICLTNKFLAYAQAGLYILATKTLGQSQFLNSLEYEAGVIMECSLEEALRNIDINLVNAVSKKERWQKAKSFSWENEQLKITKRLS